MDYGSALSLTRPHVWPTRKPCRFGMCQGSLKTLIIGLGEYNELYPPPPKKNVAEKKLAKRKVSQNDSSSDKYSPVVFNKTLGFICYGCAAAVSELISQIYALI